MGKDEIKKIKPKSFNIYYLNFPKLYEKSMMINNLIPKSISRENSSFDKKVAKIGGSLGITGSEAFLAGAKSVITPELRSERGTNSKVIESLEVKTTKSILLEQLLKQTKIEGKLSDYREGDLVKVENVKLKIFDEENLRSISLFRKDTLKGLQYQGWEIGNLFSSILDDYSYVLEGTADVQTQKILIKIPFTKSDEFESLYKVDDLLIGKVSLIGIFKGDVSKKDIEANTFNYINKGNKERENEVDDGKVISSSASDLDKDEQDKDKYKFLDIIAIIQDVEFKEIEMINKTHWLRRLVNKLKFWKHGEI